MGVERGVTRWYIQRQLILYELASLEEQVRQKQAESVSPDADTLTALQQRLHTIREKLRASGDCPKPMMG